MTETNARTADHPIQPMFIERWSPRAFTSEALPEPDLLTMVEAARWSPSSYNSQPWRFLYALRDTPDWTRFLDLLGDYNRSWAERAGALVCMASRMTMVPPGKTEAVPSYSHSFDAGAAWAYLALQASLLGWVAHGIAGFDLECAVRNLDIPDDYRVECMIAVGRHQRTAETPPANTRGPQSGFVRSGPFRA